jgi:plastocyanin
MTGDPELGNIFDPGDLTVAVGDTVVFTSMIGTHTTTSIDGFWDSGFVPAGQSYQVDFTDAEPGDYIYVCTLHFDCCGMAGIIHVVPPCCPSGGLTG